MSPKTAFFAAALVAVGGAVFLLRRPASDEPVATSSEAPGLSSEKVSQPEPGVSPRVAMEVLEASVSAQTQQKLKVLREILATKNDNDPRLDTELRTLSDEAKALFSVQYSAFPPEAHNERGTIVFLLGRNLTKPSDVDFLVRVVGEPACLSMAKCSEPDPPSKRDDEHIETAHEVTLVYAQLVALKAAERYLKQPQPQPEVAEKLRALLEAAKESPQPRVASLAEEILSRTSL